MSLVKVTTESGAVYTIDTETGKTTGGSKDLKAGHMTMIGMQLHVGRSMLIHTPERKHLNPGATVPGVMTTQIVSIEEIEEESGE